MTPHCCVCIGKNKPLLGCMLYWSLQRVYVVVGVSNGSCYVAVTVPRIHSLQSTCEPSDWKAFVLMSCGIHLLTLHNVLHKAQYKFHNLSHQQGKAHQRRGRMGESRLLDRLLGEKHRLGMKFSHRLSNRDITELWNRMFLTSLSCCSCGIQDGFTMSW